MKKIDSPDNVSLIKKQLEAQTREHDLLKNQIHDYEQFLKVSTRQCSFFILRQESGCSGYQVIPTHPLKKLFLSVFFFSFCRRVFCCASLIVSAWRAKTWDSFFGRMGQFEFPWHYWYFAVHFVRLKIKGKKGII